MKHNTHRFQPISPFFSIFFHFWVHFQYVFSIFMLARLPDTIKELQFLWILWSGGTFSKPHLTKAPGSSSRDVTAATSVAKGDIISNFKTTKESPPREKSSKTSMIDSIFLKDKVQESNPISYYIYKKFGTFIPCSTTYFTEASARVSLKVARRVSFRGKNSWKFSIFEAIFLLRKKNIRISVKFGIASVYFSYKFSAGNSTRFNEFSDWRYFQWSHF